MPTKIELTMEQSQQGVSYDVLRGLQAQVRVVRTDKGTEFLNMRTLLQKRFNTKRPLLEHLNRKALSKDGTVLLLRLLEQC
nr:hypothetical protein [Tanacetum cinerariifolium]